MVKLSIWGDGKLVLEIDSDNSESTRITELNT